MSRKTTVKVRLETKKLLAELGKKDDTYDDVIVRLIEFYRKNTDQPILTRRAKRVKEEKL